MRIAVLTLGTRGDVEPFAAVAAALAARGHRVRFAAGPEFAEAAAAVGLDFAPLGLDLKALLTDAAGQGRLGSLAGVVRMARAMRPAIAQTLDAALAAADDAEVILHHPKVLAAPHIAERTGARALVALALPALAPTAAFPSPILPVPARLAGWGRLNRCSHRLAGGLPHRLYGRMIDRWRARRLGLPPAADRGTDMLHVGGRPMARLGAFSRALVPRPADWGPHDHVTGCWFGAEAARWAPPPELLRFLAAGRPPVYVGFGSMVAGDGVARARMVIDALARAGQRGVLATGWGGLKAEVAPHVAVVAAVPHGWLFPRMAAVVHHGGSGTTHMGLRHGRPTLVCPLLGDQPFWGRRVAALGAGPPPIPLRRLTAERLAAAITDLCGRPGYRRRAEELGRAIRSEDGVAEAVRLVEGG